MQAAVAIVTSARGVHGATAAGLTSGASWSPASVLVDAHPLAKGSDTVATIDSLGPETDYEAGEVAPVNPQWTRQSRTGRRGLGAEGTAGREFCLRPDWGFQIGGITPLHPGAERFWKEKGLL